MEKWAAAAVMVGAGMLVAAQPMLNSGLGRSVGALPAALISFLVGAAVLLVIVTASGELPALGGVREVHWPYLLGGLLGVVWIATSLLTVRSLGVAGVVAATICGQLTASVVLDRLGAFGLDTIPLTPERLVGVGLLFAGTLLIVR